MSTVHAETLGARVAAGSPSLVAVARGGFWTLIAAHVWAGWGTQWDIQWHLRIGRDSFWIAPHVMTYSGVTAMVLASYSKVANTSTATRPIPATRPEATSLASRPMPTGTARSTPS